MLGAESVTMNTSVCRRRHRTASTGRTRFIHTLTSFSACSSKVTVLEPSLPHPDCLVRAHFGAREAAVESVETPDARTASAFAGELAARLRAVGYDGSAGRLMTNPTAPTTNAAAAAAVTCQVFQVRRATDGSGTWDEAWLPDGCDVADDDISDVVGGRGFFAASTVAGFSRTERPQWSHVSARSPMTVEQCGQVCIRLAWSRRHGTNRKARKWRAGQRGHRQVRGVQRDGRRSPQIGPLRDSRSHDRDEIRLTASSPQPRLYVSVPSPRPSAVRRAHLGSVRPRRPSRGPVGPSRRTRDTPCCRHRTP